MAAIGVTALGTAAGVALAHPAGRDAVPSAARADPATTCKLAGPRYVGKTSQKKRLCFTLSPDGRRLREYAYDYRWSCGAGSVRTTIKGGLPLASGGRFSSTGAQGSFFTGVVSGAKASGTARTKGQTVLPGTIPTFTSCDSGLIRWNARRGSR